MDQEIIKKLLYPNKYFKENLNTYIEACVEYYGEEYRDYIEKKLHNIHPIVYFSDFELFNRLNKLEKKYGRILVHNKFKEFYDILDANKELEYNLQTKYQKEYIKRIINYIPEELREDAIKFINSDEAFFMFCLKNDCIKLYDLINDFNSKSLYDYFSPEMDEILESKDTNEIIKNKIKEKRIEYFRLMGIRKKNYEEYEKLKEYYPPQELIDKIQKARKEIKDLVCLEYSTKKYPHNQFLKEQQELGLISDNLESYASSTIRQEYSCVDANAREENGEYVIYPEVFMCMENDDSIRDEIILHELNHVIEIHTMNINEVEIEIASGWDSFSQPITTKDFSLEEKHIPRKYERFNEIINELISSEICSKMHEKGIYIFSNPKEKSNVKCSYYDQEYIVKEFFQIYKKEIKEARISGNIEVLFNAVGKDNFEKLNELITEDYNSFDYLARKQLENDLANNKETELTKKYYSILNRKEIVLQLMERHYQSHNINDENIKQSSI